MFQAGVSLVKVDAQVSDRRGRLISDLTKQDFAVFDENQPQTITYFEREREPLDLLLLLDVSGSMRRYLEQMASNARAALAALHPGDRVGVMLFARRAEIHEQFTSDFGIVQAEMRDAVKDKSLGAGTAINEAITAAARHVAQNAGKGRRAILILTDNEGVNYRAPDEDVIRELLRADAVLNAMVSGNSRRAPSTRSAGAQTNPDFTPFDVFKLAEATGGESASAEKAGEAFREMIERIRSRYSLQYPAPVAGAPGFRRVRVELTESARKRYPAAVVRARSGYFAQ